ncbi:MAG: hypothetical protein ACJZ1Y_03570 [Candidatus Neomarinimicrobiota bacterium]
MEKTFNSLIFSLFFFFSFVHTQELPTFNFDYHKRLFDHDFGKSWNTLSTFLPANYSLNIKRKDIDSDSLHHVIKIGSSYNFKNDYEIFGYLSVKHENFHSYLYPRVVTNVESFHRFTGVPKDKDRLSFISGETDLSGISYSRDGLYFHFGRGRESWGAGEEIQLVLSHNSPSYEYFKFLYDQNRFRFIYFHGFLETINENNRYMTGKGLEISNHKNLVASISEVIIYSGMNRPIDFAFLNPISSVLEVEQNNRQNLLGFDNANAIWQLSIDRLIKNRLRISGNLIIDEFILDSEQIDSGKVNGFGWSFRTSYNFIKNNNHINLYISALSISTHALKHGIGFNNFVQRGHPLGWQNGSDGYGYKIGFKTLRNESFIFNIEINKNFSGENNIKYSPYQQYHDYKNTAFPSGDVLIQTNFLINFILAFNSRASLFFNYQYIDNIESNDNIVKIKYVYSLF